MAGAGQPVPRSLVEAAYAGLRNGDREALDRVLAPEFTARFAEGMPVGGGRHVGARECQENGWWAIGRRFAVVPEPNRWIACEDGSLLVIGRYVGTRHSDGAPVDASFMHLWSASGDRLTGLTQITDTARWPAAEPA